MAIWHAYSDKFLLQNPLAAILRVSSMPAWYFGVLSDRWSKDLWSWTIYTRDLHEALGAAWFVSVFGLVYLAFRSRFFWLSLVLVVCYLSAYMLFPRLHIGNPYYQVENVALLCAAVVAIIEGLFRRGHVAAGYGIAGITLLSQIATLYSGTYAPLLFDDLHKHPYYLSGLAIKQATQPDSVLVVFGLGWGADVSYYAERRSLVIADWFPPSLVHEMLFEQREHWLGGRKLGALVDCAVFDNQRIAPALEPIRDALKQEMTGQVIEVTGSFQGATVNPPGCKIYLAPN
jgi:hypothetical protein